MRIKTTNSHKKYWRERKIDWQAQYLSTWDHPHRQLLVWVLQTIPWISLWEVGCGPGANLVKIVQTFKDRQLGGSDVNEDAIELARKTFSGGKFHVESAENMLLSDDAVDLLLSDATLIYVGPTKIKKTLQEMYRITRNHLVFCEFHSNKWWRRWWLRYKTGYNAYNYIDLLEELGCYDVRTIKIPREYWDDGQWGEFGYIITAKLPSK